jgi:branched-chain amino acid aminotransferase group I
MTTTTTTTTTPDATPSCKQVTVLHCWSAPRSRSTALLYSFAGRPAQDGDNNAVVGLDEPLYRAWLAANDAASRPYRSSLLTGVPPTTGEYGRTADWQREQVTWAERLEEAAAALPAAGGLLVCKHMAKQAVCYDFDRDYQGNAAVTTTAWRHVHLLLVRDPVAVLSAWGAVGTNHGHQATPDEVGILPLLHIYGRLCQTTTVSSSKDERRWAVLDADDLVRDPPTVLQHTCQALGLATYYSERMLTWPAGPKPCDGPWADWWYQSVHKSTGWEVKETDSAGGSSRRYRTLPPALYPALQAAMPAYDYLKSLTYGYAHRGPPPAELYEDPRNENLLVYVGASLSRGHLVPRQQAGVSPWDSSVQGGDAAWEGLRVYRGKILCLDKHLCRLMRSAKALGFENVHTPAAITEAIFQTLAANGMRDGAHMRLTLTRGEKCTSSMNPQFNVYGTTLIVLAEWKATQGRTTYDNTKGISLISASLRRNSPNTVDSKIHHNNMINNILPKMQANLANCADAIMLDVEGYVSETNATNIFMVDDEGTLLTPHGDHCLPGITRANVLLLAKELGLPHEVRRVSLAEFHAAEEVFTTGTMGELTPVTRIDGRVIGSGQRGPLTQRLQEAYQALPERPGWATALPPFE